MKLWPVFVPTRGRAGIGRLLGLLAFERLKATMVVEPPEERIYRQTYPFHDVLVLPKADQGLAYSRNEILKSARKRKATWHWMIDDDVTRFHEIEAGKARPCEAGVALLGAQASAVDGVGQLALDYQQFAWRAGGRTVVNSFCDVVVGNRADLGLAYDSELLMKEDRDYTMQVLARGLQTLRVTRWAFSAPKNGSNAGGLSEMYRQAGRERLAVDQLVRKWPGCVEHQTKPDGRQDAKINWRKVRREAA